MEHEFPDVLCKPGSASNRQGRNRHKHRQTDRQTSVSMQRGHLEGGSHTVNVLNRSQGRYLTDKKSCQWQPNRRRLFLHHQGLPSGVWQTRLVYSAQLKMLTDRQTTRHETGIIMAPDGATLPTSGVTPVFYRRASLQDRAFLDRRSTFWAPALLPAGDALVIGGEGI